MLYDMTPTGSGGGITGGDVPTYEINYIQVNTYADLPAAGTVPNEAYIVLTQTGTWLLGTQKKSGLYYSNGVSWSYMGNSISIDDTATSNESVWSSTKTSTEISNASGGSSLVAEHIVVDTHATSVVISGLDINTDKTYILQMELKNSSGSGCLYNIFYNGITTTTDYWTSRVIAASHTQEYTAWVIDATSNGFSPIGEFTIMKDVDNRPVCTGKGRRNGTSASSNISVTQTYIMPVANITSLSIVASVANGLGIGSRIRLYKGLK